MTAANAALRNPVPREECALLIASASILPHKIRRLPASHLLFGIEAGDATFSRALSRAHEIAE